nr:MAG TPA: hypothetical protein [Caudoviricetes sp.]
MLDAAYSSRRTYILNRKASSRIRTYTLSLRRALLFR